MERNYQVSWRERQYTRAFGFLIFAGLMLSLWGMANLGPATLAGTILAATSCVGIPVILLFIGFRLLYKRDPVAASRALKSVFFDTQPFG